MKSLHEELDPNIQLWTQLYDQLESEAYWQLWQWAEQHLEIRIWHRLCGILWGQLSESLSEVS